MTLSIQTRCPQCYSLFDVSEEQLDQVDVKGRCGQCQQVFLVNDHLIASTDSHPAILENDFENNKDTFNQQGIKNIAGRGSYNFASVVYRIASDICLGIETDNSTDANTTNAVTKNKASKKIVEKPKVKDTQYIGEHDLEAAALDSFNAWQAPITKKSHHADSPVNSKQQLVDKVNKTSSDKLTAAIDAKAPANNSSTSIEPKNSPRNDLAINDKSDTQAGSASVKPPTTNKRDLIHDSALHKNDETISIDKRVKKESSLSEASSSTTNLTHLLTNKNTVLDYKPSLDQPYNNPALERIQSTTAPTSTPVATLLWLAGCAVLVLLLMAQYVIFNLDTLIKNPLYAKRLQAICSIAICALPNADLSAFDTTQLSVRRSRVNTYANFSDLQGELVNNSVQAQLLPNLRVSVYSEAGLLGAFIATPEDYLLSNQSQLGSEQSLGIMFTIPLSVQNISRFTLEPIY